MSLRWSEEDLADYCRRAGPPARSSVPSEDEEQITLMAWVRYMTPQIPSLALLFHIPNGGSRHPAEAGKLRAMGVRPGVPDLFLPVPRGEHHGLFIEMKRVEGGTLARAQRDWLDDLNARGYRAEVCHGWEEARDALMNYLKEEAT